MQAPRGRTASHASVYETARARRTGPIQPAFFSNLTTGGFSDAVLWSASDGVPRLTPLNQEVTAHGADEVD